MKYAQTKTCPICSTKPYYWKHNCSGCMACKIIYLRSPDGKLSRKLQSAILDKLHAEKRAEVLGIVKKLDSNI